MTMLRPTASWYTAEHKLWLNVGSGPYALENFVNLDNHPFLQVARVPGLTRLLPSKYQTGIRQFREAAHVGVLVHHDCRVPLPIAPASVDHILCSHFLEHLYPDQAREVVGGFRRALKPGGTLHLIVPDLERLARDYLDRSAEIGAADFFLDATMLTREARPSWRYRIMELLGFDGLRHRWMYDRGSLRQLLTELKLELLSEVPNVSAHVRRDDEQSLHVAARKPAN
jgi:SAM-dependent methyltransferase